jgi:phage terminase large subunit-like protein
MACRTRTGSATGSSSPRRATSPTTPSSARRSSTLGTRWEIGELGYDRWNATQLATDLTQDGASCIAIPQTSLGLGPAWRELEKLMLEHRVRHGGHPILRWMAGNVEVDTDSAGNQKPSKRLSSERIDGMVALTMAESRLMAHLDEAPSVYEQRGAVVFG